MISIKNMLALIPVLATLANAGNAPNCNRFPGQKVRKSGVLEGLNKIYNGASDNCGSNDDGSCDIHACRNGADIYVCAKNPGHSTPQCRDVADLASNIHCERGNGDAVEGDILGTAVSPYVQLWVWYAC